MAENQVVTEKSISVDFKIVSFTLAGKEYGIDIMKVKEIRKAGNFTKVPNTPSFVRGVDNLRGEIIPIIDLRIMFHLPSEEKEPGNLENIVILKVEELILGVIVDSIEKVIGLSKKSIQAPHPLFGDINIQYIQGVVEHGDALYILLDVDKIFAKPTLTTASSGNVPTISPETTLVKQKGPSTDENLELKFVTESLAAFAGFYVSEVNRSWVVERLKSWKTERLAKGLDFQFSEKKDSEEFLVGFLSHNTQSLWAYPELESLAKSLKFEGTSLSVWNIGCGKGYESYSLALMLELFFPGLKYKIWANDSDLLDISTAPTLAFPEEDLPQEYRRFGSKVKSGFQFSSNLKNNIYFEFHDIKNVNPFRDLALIVARDLLSFFKPAEQEQLVNEFRSKLKSGGYLILGQHEGLVEGSSWRRIPNDFEVVFQKIS
jgi:purine-binding chemotaxis protein CheW